MLTEIITCQETIIFRLCNDVSFLFNIQMRILGICSNAKLKLFKNAFLVRLNLAHLSMVVCPFHLAQKSHYSFMPGPGINGSW